MIDFIYGIWDCPWYSRNTERKVYFVKYMFVENCNLMIYFRTLAGYIKKSEKRWAALPGSILLYLLLATPFHGQLVLDSWYAERGGISEAHFSSIGHGGVLQSHIKHRHSPSRFSFMAADLIPDFFRELRQLCFAMPPPRQKPILFTAGTSQIVPTLWANLVRIAMRNAALPDLSSVFEGDTPRTQAWKHLEKLESSVQRDSFFEVQKPNQGVRNFHCEITPARKSSHLACILLIFPNIWQVEWPA
jgi:hypothetical protein